MSGGGNVTALTKRLLLSSSSPSSSSKIPSAAVKRLTITNNVQRGTLFHAASFISTTTSKTADAETSIRRPKTQFLSSSNNKNHTNDFYDYSSLPPSSHHYNHNHRNFGTERGKEGRRFPQKSHYLPPAYRHKQQQYKSRAPQNNNNKRYKPKTGSSSNSGNTRFRKRAGMNDGGGGRKRWMKPTASFSYYNHDLDNDDKDEGTRSQGSYNRRNNVISTTTTGGYNPSLQKMEIELASHLLQYKQILFLNNNTTFEQSTTTGDVLKEAKKDYEQGYTSSSDEEEDGDEKWWKNKSSASESSSKKENVTRGITLEQLSQSEYHYKEMCRLLSQIIRIYSFSSHHHHHDHHFTHHANQEDEDDDDDDDEMTSRQMVVDTPLKRAEEFLDQFESLRHNRLQMIEGALQDLQMKNEALLEKKEIKNKEEVVAEEEKKSLGFVESITKFFFSGTDTNTTNDDDDDNEKEEKEINYHDVLEEKNITAHASKDYIPSKKLYHGIIKGAIRRSPTFSKRQQQQQQQQQQYHLSNETSSSSPISTPLPQQPQSTFYNEATAAAVTSLRLLSKLKQKSEYSPTTKMYNDVIRVCCKVGTVNFAKRGEKLLREMQAVQLGQMEEEDEEEEEEKWGEELSEEDEEGEESTDTEKWEGSSVGSNESRRRSKRRRRRRRAGGGARRQLRTRRRKQQQPLLETSTTKENKNDQANETEGSSSKQRQNVIFQRPTSYNFVMGGYKNSLSNHYNYSGGGGGRMSANSKRKVVQAVEDLFHEMLKSAEKREENDSSAEEENEKEEDKSNKTIFRVSPNKATYNLLVATWCNAGHDVIPDLCEKVDKVLIQMMGSEDAFRSLVGEQDEVDNHDESDGTITPQEAEEGEETNETSRKHHHHNMEPDILMLHYLTEIYASTKERKYVNRSIHLLQEMERRRSKALKILATVEKEEEEEQKGNKKYHGNQTHHRHQGSVVPKNDLFFPTTTTYNNVLRGLLKVRRNSEKEYDDTVYHWRSLSNNDRKNGLSFHDNDYNDYSNIGGGEENSSSQYGNNVIQQQVTQDAIYASTHLLDSMMAHESSLPNQFTFIMLLKLWKRICSPISGEMAEEILSKMEVMRSAHRDPLFDEYVSYLSTDASSSFSGGGGSMGGDNGSGGGSGNGNFSIPSLSNHVQLDTLIYRLVMECWANSAMAGRPGAAMSALALLDQAEAQCRRIYPVDIAFPVSPKITTANNTLHDVLNNRDKIMKTQNIYNEAARPNQLVYSFLIKVCSKTKHKEDMPQALMIAFDVYNRMIDRGVQPTATLYTHLLGCCANLIPPQPKSPSWSSSSHYNGSSLSSRNRMELAETVFEAACHQGQVNNNVLKILKRANYPLYESYIPSPEHSARVGRTGGTTTR